LIEQHYPGQVPSRREWLCFQWLCRRLSEEKEERLVKSVETSTERSNDNAAGEEPSSDQ
jgi:hypothetical protein